MTGKDIVPDPADAERAGQACRELARLLGLTREVPTDALLRAFADPEQRALLSRPGQSVADIAARIEWLSAGAEPAGPPPAGATMTAAVAGFWSWARSGFGMVDADMALGRLAACGGCPCYRPAPRTVLHMLAATALHVPKDMRVCSHCGCFMEKKARQASAGCPEPDPDRPGLSRWGDPLRPSGTPAVRQADV